MAAASSVWAALKTVAAWSCSDLAWNCSRTWILSTMVVGSCVLAAVWIAEYLYLR